MKAETEPIDSNKVWDLVEALANIKPIGCKWIYKRKRGSDGKVKTFKSKACGKRIYSEKGH